MSHFKYSTDLYLPDPHEFTQRPARPSFYFDSLFLLIGKYICIFAYYLAN